LRDSADIRVCGYPNRSIGWSRVRGPLSLILENNNGPRTNESGQLACCVEHFRDVGLLAKVIDLDPGDVPFFVHDKDGAFIDPQVRRLGGREDAIRLRNFPVRPLKPPSDFCQAT